MTLVKQFYFPFCMSVLVVFAFPLLVPVYSIFREKGKPKKGHICSAYSLNKNKGMKNIINYK